MNSIETTNSTNEASMNNPEKHPLEEMGSFEDHMQRDIEKVPKKSFEEKARENSYYKKEDGTWWWSYGGGFDDFDEEVKWFKLDEEYPDLADRTEALAEKYNVDYNDRSGLKEQIYKHANELEKASDRHLAIIFRIAGAVSCAVSNTEKIMVEYNSNDLESIYNCLDRYYGDVAGKMPEGKLDKRIKRIGEVFVRNFDDKLVEGDFIERLVEYSTKAFLENRNSVELISGIEDGIRGIATNEESGEVFGEYMNYLDGLLDDKEKISRHDTRAQVFCRYVRNHGVNSSAIDGFQNVIFPLMKQRDYETTPILEGNNAYGVTTGEYGVADYAEECLLSSFCPSDIDKLIRIYHEIPTSDYKKFEQNRKDAARLQGTIIGGRDFIHDERPGANEVLVAIKEFYENHTNDNASKYRERLEMLENKYHFGILPYAFNLEMYEKPIEEMSDYNVAEEGSPDETALDILNRLISNTKPSILEPPKTRDSILNGLMKDISPTINEKIDKVYVNYDKVGIAVSRMNEILLENKDKQGVFPSTVSAVAFLDKMSAYALRNISKKELQELPFDPLFKEMVRFSQLTSSTEYNSEDFESKYQQILDKVGAAYDEDGVDSLKVIDGYRLLSQKILLNVQALSNNYTSKKTTARFKDAVWSGNLSDELIGLFEKV